MIDLSSARPKPSVTVRELLGQVGQTLELRLLAGEQGLERRIEHPRIQKSGLALVGHLRGLVPPRIQILGETELSFVEALAPDQQEMAAHHLFSLNLCCLVVTRGAAPPAAFLEEAARTATPVLGARERSSVTIARLHTFLDERLAPRARVHGVLVDVFEVGVLLHGKSGVGKSETALELIMRGHRLVADDIVECDYRPPGKVFGEPASLLRHHLEVRGLGILDIKDLFGVTAIRGRKRIDLLAGLELMENDGAIDRLGLERHSSEILGVGIPQVTVPVRPGRNVSAIIEIAARRELLRQTGQDPARAFVDRVDARSDSRAQSSKPGAANPEEPGS